MPNRCFTGTNPRQAVKSMKHLNLDPVFLIEAQDEEMGVIHRLSHRTHSSKMLCLCSMLQFILHLDLLWFKKTRVITLKCIFPWKMIFSN